MTTRTIGSAVAKRDSGADAQIKAYRADFATVLPSHLRADTWVRAAQGLLRRDAKLLAVAQDNPDSLIAALLDCARWGLEPGVTYHLVPFGKEIVGIRDYKGIVELMYRAGAVSSVKAEVVYAKDSFDYDPETMQRPRHEPAASTDGRPNWFTAREQRGGMVGAYAYAEMREGGVSQVVIMADWEIAEHKAASKTANQPDSMWRKWPRSAWKKTVARELEKWVPSSPEWITHKVRAERAGEQSGRELSPAARALPPPVLEDEIVDGEVVDSQGPGPQLDEPDWDALISQHEAARDSAKLWELRVLARRIRPRDGELLNRIVKAWERAKATLASADAATQAPNKSQMNRLIKLLGEGGVTSDEGRDRLAAHVLERDDVTVKSLTANDVSQLIIRLETLKADGQLGVQVDRPEQPTDTEGDQP